MKNQINEVKRMQQLAGILKEEYIKYNSKPSPNASVSVEIETPQGIIDVELKGKVIVEPGAFGYEYGGVSGTYNPGDNIYVEEIEWDKENYSDEENSKINNYVDENFEEIENNLIEDFNKSRDNY